MSSILAIAALLEAGYGALLLALFIRAHLRAAASCRNRGEADALRPAIREAVLSYFTGRSNLPQLREFGKSHRALLIESLLEFRVTVTGEARERLWDLCMELGVVYDWCTDARSREVRARRAAFKHLALACIYEPCRRLARELQLNTLHDPDREVRLAAARGLAQSENPEDLELVFQMAVSPDMLARVFLTEALRPWAVVLCENAIPKVLRSADEPSVRAALEIVNAWGRAVPLFELHRLIEEGSKRVRLQALGALRLVPACPENRQVVIRAVSDPDPEIALEAMAAAGALQIRETEQALAQHSRTGSPRLAKAASETLAALRKEREMSI